MTPPVYLAQSVVVHVKMEFVSVLVPLIVQVVQMALKPAVLVYLDTIYHLTAAMFALTTV
jgi:hypothetical protein